MCRDAALADVLSIGSWTAMHGVSMPMAVTLTMAALALTGRGPARWTVLAVVGLHAGFTVLHWTDEWLETHTPYGFEYFIGNLLGTGGRECEAENNWYYDSPGDALTGYFGSAAHVAVVALAERAPWLAAAASAAPGPRLWSAAAGVALFVAARPLAIATEVSSAGFFAMGAACAGATALVQGAAAYAAQGFARRAPVALRAVPPRPLPPVPPTPARAVRAGGRGAAVRVVPPGARP